MAVEINEIEYSQWVLQKVSGKHSLTMDDVFDAVENYESAGWEEHPEYGRRLLVRGRTSRGVLSVYLYPVNEVAGTFRLGTALY